MTEQQRNVDDVRMAMQLEDLSLKKIFEEVATNTAMEDIDTKQSSKTERLDATKEKKQAERKEREERERKEKENFEAWMRNRKNAEREMGGYPTAASNTPAAHTSDDTDIGAATIEQPPHQTAAMKSLHDALFIEDFSKISYPPSILSPSLALNANALSDRKFKYNKEFLLQFQKVYMEKPLVDDWDAINASFTS
ncbi:Eukaryotic translation initiation factor 4G1 domain containing protein [Elaphomyces granulatus]